MTDPSPFVKDDIEQALLGGLLLSPAQSDSVPNLTPDDFYRPRHALIFRTIREALDQADGKVDHLVVLETLTRNGDLDKAGGAPYLMTCIQACPLATQVPYYADTVQEAARRRSLLIAAQKLVQAAEHADGEMAREQVADLLVHVEGLLDDTGDDDEVLREIAEFGEFVQRQQDKPREFVIPGLLAVMERVILVAGEGSGKSSWGRQIAVCLGQGRHPLMPSQRIPARRVLMVDLENPPDLIGFESRRIVQAAKKANGLWESENVYLWSRPAGINLRKQSDVALLDRVMAHVRPALMVIGPLYKASLSGTDQAEQVALETAGALDRLRTKHRCALWIEAHAPMAQNGVRELRPFGSGVWSRWPEFGRTLVPDTSEGAPKGQAFLVGKFRPDRGSGRIWPDSMTWGREWPWDAHWNAGPPYPEMEETA